MSADFNVEAFFEEAGSHGWDWFKEMLKPGERDPRVRKEDVEEAKQLAIDAAAVYATPQGKRLIDHLIRVTLYRVTFTTMLGLEMEKTAPHGIFREGQNAITFLICKMIAEGRQKPTTERSEQ